MVAHPARGLQVVVLSSLPFSVFAANPAKQLLRRSRCVLIFL